MSDSEKPKPDGSIMTTMDDVNRIMITEEEGGMSLDNLIEVFGDQAQAITCWDEDVAVPDYLPVVTAASPVTAAEEASAEEGASMIVSVDPAMCSFSSAFVSADEALLIGSPPSSAVIPASLIPEKEEEEEISGKGRKKVVGRRQAVIDDDGESQSSISAASADGDASLASSSGVKRKGFKRGRRTMKDMDLVDERKMDSGSSTEQRKKKKGKKKEVRATPEEEVSEGKYGEPRGIIEQALEDLSSSVLGAAVMEWANKIDEIRVKSKNLQGKLSGEIKRCVTKIKEGTTLLVIRSEATGDPHFLRMRNSELVSQIREMERDNARLEEQLKRMSPKKSPPRKRRITKIGMASDSACSVPADSADSKVSGAMSSLIRETFPPLPQRTPRGTSVAIKSTGSDRVTPVAGTSSAVPGGSADVGSGIESYYQRRIDALVSARDLEIEKKRKEQLGKELVGSQERRNEKDVKDGNRGRDFKDGGSKKVGPRILSDIQIAPPLLERLGEGVLSPAMTELEAEWRTAMGGRRRGRGKPLRPRLTMPPPPSSHGVGVDPPPALRGADVANVAAVRATQGPLNRRPPRDRPPRPPRPPAFSAVTITGRAEGFSYASALKSAREHIDIGALGIQTKRVRKAINGGLVIEVSGENSKVKAEELVARLQDLLKESAVVSCPVKKRELRVIGFDESVTPDEISEVMGEIGQCPVSDIKVGPIRFMSNGSGMVWAQLPVAAAAKIAEVGRIRIGWTVARVELLKARPLQCFRCWSFGHVQSSCRSVVDRRGACFRCGQSGHIANACGNTAHCAVCHDAGLEAAHRLGGPQCMAQTQQQRSANGRPTTMTT